MIEGDWKAIKEQVMAEITDKAPLVAHAYSELIQEFRARGERPSITDLSIVCVIWVNMIVSEIDHRIKEIAEDSE